MPVPMPNFQAILVVLLLALLFASSPFPSVSAAQSPDASYFAVTPSAATIFLSEEASFSAIDSSGRPLSNVQWSVDPPLADVRVENGEGTITAKQSGRVTITATAGSKTASASL
jgi:Big-like domain-containing protein